MGRTARTFWSVVHRWSGLALAICLLVAGLGGAVIAFYGELDPWLNPHLYEAQPRGAARSPLELRERAEQLFPQAHVDSVPLRRVRGKAVLFDLTPRIDPTAAMDHALPANQVFLDPYTGDLLGAREWGAFRIDSEHLLPLIYRLHYELMIPEPWGRWLFGTAALVWAFNCFIGLYLTMPRARARFFLNWKRAWQLQWSRVVERISFDLHRALGLWLWAIFLVFAVSAVYLNLYYEVFGPMLRTVLTVEQVEPSERSGVAPITGEPPLEWEAAWQRGRELMAARAREQGFSVDWEASLDLDRAAGTYVYSVNSSLDISDEEGQTSVYLSAADGADLGFVHPRIASGNTVIAWLQALHTAQVWGTPLQVAVSTGGVGLAAVTLTGVIIWLKRRRRPARSRA